MPLHMKVDGDGPDGQRLAIDPLLAGDGESVPKHRLPDIPMSPDMAYEIVHDELMLDGNARLNLPRVASINTSGHKYGRVHPGLGWAIWRDPETLPEELVFRVNYLGGDMPTFALNFSRPGSQIVAQYFSFLRLGFEGCRRVQQECRDVATYGAAAIAELGPFERITDGTELPVFALPSSLSSFGTMWTTTRPTTSPAVCASAASRCPRIRSLRTGRISSR
jgi:glutamate decarboxylase